MEIFDKLYPFCIENMKKYQNKMKNDVDGRRRIKVMPEKGGEFAVGEIVFYKNRDKTSKWEPDYCGPGKIVSINRRTGNYTICNPKDREEILINNAPPHWIIPFHKGPGSVVSKGIIPVTGSSGR